MKNGVLQTDKASTIFFTRKHFQRDTEKGVQNGGVKADPGESTTLDLLEATRRKKESLKGKFLNSM